MTLDINNTRKGEVYEQLNGVFERHCRSAKFKDSSITYEGEKHDNNE